MFNPILFRCLIQLPFQLRNTFLIFPEIRHSRLNLLFPDRDKTLQLVEKSLSRFLWVGEEPSPIKTVGYIPKNIRGHLTSIRRAYPLNVTMIGECRLPIHISILPYHSFLEVIIRQEINLITLPELT